MKKEIEKYKQKLSKMKAVELAEEWDKVTAFLRKKCKRKG